MFITTLLQQPRHRSDQTNKPSTSTWIKQDAAHMYTLGDSRVSRTKKGILPFATRMGLEGNMLGEVCQTKTNLYDFTYMCSLKQNKTKKLMEKRSVCGYQGQWWRVREMDQGGQKVQLSIYK